MGDAEGFKLCHGEVMRKQFLVVPLLVMQDGCLGQVGAADPSQF